MIKIKNASKITLSYKKVNLNRALKKYRDKTERDINEKIIFFERFNSTSITWFISTGKTNIKRENPKAFAVFKKNNNSSLRGGKLSKYSFTIEYSTLENIENNRREKYR